MLVFFDDIRVGDVIRVAWTINGANPVFGNRYSDSFSLGWNIDMERRRVRVLSHPSRQITHKVFGSDAVPRVGQVDRWREVTLDLAGVGAIENEDYLPYDWILYPWIQLSEWGSWRDVVDWAMPLYERSIRRPKELSEIAGEIKTVGDDTAIAARNWVSNPLSPRPSPAHDLAS